MCTFRTFSTDKNTNQLIITNVNCLKWAVCFSHSSSFSWWKKNWPARIAYVFQRKAHILFALGTFQPNHCQWTVYGVEYLRKLRPNWRREFEYCWIQPNSMISEPFWFLVQQTGMKVEYITIFFIRSCDPKFIKLKRKSHRFNWLTYEMNFVFEKTLSLSLCMNKMNICYDFVYLVYKEWSCCSFWINQLFRHWIYFYFWSRKCARIVWFMMNLTNCTVSIFSILKAI